MQVSKLLRHVLLERGISARELARRLNTSGPNIAQKLGRDNWSVSDLAAIAAEDKDYASSNMLVWFIDEQVEEEASARDMITACEAVEGNKFGLYMLDKELAARVYTQASPLANA